MRDLYVQYGCGFTAPPGWLSFDSSPTLRFERLPILGRLYGKIARPPATYAVCSQTGSAAALTCGCGTSAR